MVRIFTTKCREVRQNKAATTKQLGLNWSQKSLPLYPWAEIVTEGEYPDDVRYSIYLTTGKQGEFEDEPSYCATHESAGSPEIRVMGRTEHERTHSGCAVLTLCHPDDTDDVFVKVNPNPGENASAVGVEIQVLPNVTVDAGVGGDGTSIGIKYRLDY